MSSMWNPWHGCRRKSEGCANCYVHRNAGKYGGNANLVKKNQTFDLPVQRLRNGEYKLKSGELVYTCFTSDFFTPEADAWRPEAWAMIRERSDCHFFWLTKRIERFFVGLPADWQSAGEKGWQHVTICCTCENQKRAAERLPVYLELPIFHKQLALEPLLGPLDLTAWLGPEIRSVAVGGESGPEARPLDYAWVLAIREQCMAAGVAFHFRQTGARLIKDGRLYKIRRELQASQARKACIDWEPGR